ncbi:hypothetical protein [Roseivirga misakiensis]|uniref:DUF4358 domain-containing protein n=1 Tax=Roseivirga misakiensis TaxID=1563681 RepID=A0A1E5T5B9_9BACT|nr:hypothetical protein [Roseivirga misakiensis]OEK06581.1 hypothetical protein BFP71_02615 [Roseivirga misakiensis]
MLKRLLFTSIAIVAISTTISAQSLTKTEKSAITKRVEAFIKGTIDKDYTGLLEFTYPKLFTMASKEMMLATFESMEDMGLNMMVDVMKIQQISALHESGNDQYALVKYSTEMRIGVSGQMAQPEAIASLEASFVNAYGKENVSYNEEKKQFEASGIKHMVLIKEEAYGPEWYIMEWNTDNPAIIQALLSPEVIQKASERIK